MQKKEKSVCLIPARGGSKRIPRKNIKLFAGKPIIAWPIQLSLSTKIFERVVVSTDDHEIAKVSEHYGAEIPFMREGLLADDNATITDVIVDTLEKFSEQNIFYEYLFLIYPTAPNARAEDIAAGFSLLKNKKYDSVLSIVRFDFPIQRALKMSDDGKIDYINPKYTYTRSQDLDTCYHDAGQWIWIDVKKFKSNGYKLVSQNSGSVTLDPLLYQDIDDDTDWQIAEQKMKYQTFLKNI